MAHLRTMGGIDSATPQQINPGGISYVLVQYHGDASALALALSARGWIAESAGTVVRIRSATNKPPPIPPPPQPQQPATPPAQVPTQNKTGTEG
jgi:hypothetical protein